MEIHKFTKKIKISAQESTQIQFCVPLFSRKTPAFPQSTGLHLLAEKADDVMMMFMNAGNAGI